MATRDVLKTFALCSSEQYGVQGLIETVQEIEDSGTNFVSITDKIDTSTSTGQFFFHFMAAMAEWERNLICERTKAGIAAKKTQSVQFGRKHKIEGNSKRLAAVRKIGPSDLGKMLDHDLLAVINEVDPKAKPIKNVATMRRWRRAGYSGLSIE